MDFHNLQRKLFNIEPTNPVEDLAKLKAQASNGAVQPAEVTPKVKTAKVAEGSLPMDKDYSLNDFAALAGVGNYTPRPAQPVMESGPDPIIVQDKDTRIAQLEERVARLESLLERSLSKGEEKEKERIVKGMKKAKGDFKDRYGDDAEAVMYATATKMAKKSDESIKERLFAELAKFDLKK